MKQFTVASSFLRTTRIVIIAGTCSADLVARYVVARIRHTQLESGLLGNRIGDACKRLGGIFPKVAQLLSARPDLLSSADLSELRSFQMEFEPISLDEVRSAIRRSGLADSIDLDSISATPIGSGCIAQVHSANRTDGSLIAIKVLRPEMKKRIELDLRLLTTVGAVVGRIPTLRNAPIQSTIDRIRSAILEQADLVLEARRAEALYRAFATTPGIRIPRICPPLSNEHVLTMELIETHHHPATDVLPEALRQQGVERALDALFDMIFVHGLIHADMHPGNLRLDDEGNPILFDFGLMTELNVDMRREFRRLFFAMAAGDGLLCARIAVQTAVVIPPDLDHRRLNDDFCKMIARFTRQNVRNFSVVAFGRSVFDILNRHRIVGSPEFTLTIMSILIFEGVLKLAHPDLDFQSRAQSRLLAMPAHSGEFVSDCKSIYERLVEDVEATLAVGACLAPTNAFNQSL